jgi:hypothetical protein
VSVLASPTATRSASARSASARSAVGAVVVASSRRARSHEPAACAAFFVMFTAPKVYETYKDHIDEGLSQARVHARRGYDSASTEVNKFVERVPALQNMRRNVEKKTE